MNFDKIEPKFYISENNKKDIKKIEKELSLINLNNKIEIKSRVRSIYSSLAIEDNSLPLESVERIIENKLVLGDKKDIQEVKNANELYEHMNEYNWKDEKDFLKAHTLLMKYFEDDGYYRKHGEGVKKGDEVIYMAPNSLLVPSLMKSLFKFINEEEIHPLILSSIFHYYFVAIHPFSDGNGRIARLWQNIILYNWKNIFEYLPIESRIYKYQEEYYDAIAKCHVNGDSNVFIEFMLKMISESLDEVSLMPIDNNTININNLLDVMEINKPMTSKEIMKKLKIKSKETLRNNYLDPAIDAGYVKLTIPDKPTSKNQMYYKVSK